MAGMPFDMSSLSSILNVSLLVGSFPSWTEEEGQEPQQRGNASRPRSAAVVRSWTAGRARLVRPAPVFSAARSGRAHFRSPASLAIEKGRERIA